MIMAYVHAASYRYYTIYLILPLVLMIRDGNKDKLEAYIFYSLFGAIFTIPIWCINSDPEHWMCACAYLLGLYSIITDIKEPAYTKN